ncbi:unnamed protein product [Peniophora sp. CBMAI 1063]|nr:unnamed protein product [Peniophora sp. CBMAI 1063]
MAASEGTILPPVAPIANGFSFMAAKGKGKAVESAPRAIAQPPPTNSRPTAPAFNKPAHVGVALPPPVFPLGYGPLIKKPLAAPAASADPAGSTSRKRRASTDLTPSSPTKRGRSDVGPENVAPTVPSAPVSPAKSAIKQSNDDSEDEEDIDDWAEDEQEDLFSGMERMERVESTASGANDSIAGATQVNSATQDNSTVHQWTSADLVTDNDPGYFRMPVYDSDHVDADGTVATLVKITEAIPAIDPESDSFDAWRRDV